MLIREECIIACICEGAAEIAIMDILLDNNKLIFAKEQLLDEEIIKTRSASEFQNKHLKKHLDKKIQLFRILDSRSEQFKLGKAYKDKVEIINVITAPEIEILIICSEGHLDKYKRTQNMKPNEYCKSVLNMKKVKSYNFVKEYFSDVNKLILALKHYKSKSKIRIGESTIADLLR
ncbi:MAG: hypothetical protein AB9836_14305 [Aminipila sp.]